ncbi:hypothetical protein CSAL01_12952 [Colletotrichum salicis]|uniref:Uncharacterized protein n=1 Tax=Colletotrichum salicis TaxID=1209931 RepID=A0A135URJ1_9PEZI|nr:hypothetical protein CSAL01_12952 [Colletotrichum salicis]
MASDKTSQLFWLQYSDAIRQKVGVGSGDKQDLLSWQPKPQKGPLAGNNVPDASHRPGTNWQGKPTAVPKSFANELQGGKSSPALDSAFLVALKNQAAYQKSPLTTNKTSARAQWKKDTEYGMTDQPFEVWAEGDKAPAWQAAKDRVDRRISQTITNLQLQQNSPMSVTVKEDRDRLRKGKNEDTDYNGFDMRAASGNILSTAELTRTNILSGDAIPEPPFSTAYLCNEQRLQLTPRGSRSTSIPGRTRPTTNFGQTKGGANVGVSNGWFSFNAGASHSSESSNLQLGSESSQVQVAITYNDLKAITITTGACRCLDRRDPRHQAQGVHERWRQHQRLWHSPSVGLGGSGSSTTENQSHKTSWDKASLTSKIVPNFDNNCATVVGVVAEPFDIKA